MSVARARQARPTRSRVEPCNCDTRLRDDGFTLRYSTTNRHEAVAVLSDWLFVRRQQTIDL